MKICAQVGQPDFVTAHKLLVDLFYKYLSRNESITLRDAPLPSLSSAVANAFGILATNAEFLKKEVSRIAWRK